MTKFRWCFIGAGDLARTVANQLGKSGRHQVVSVYTRNFEKGQAFAEKHGAKAYLTAEEAITAEGVDAVYIVTPHSSHYKYAKLALELGKPVFCEKAFTVTAKETDELIALAKEKNVYLCEAMWTWFSESANKTKQWIDENKIGRVRSADFSYHVRTIDRKGRHTDPKRAGGALLDITIYPITYAYRLWGTPAEIESVGVIKEGIDHSEKIVFTYPEGFKVYISASVADFKGLEKMSIKGENGEIKAPFYHCANGVTYQKSLFKKERFKGKGPKFNTYLDEFDAVAEDIRAGRTESKMVPLKATSDVMHILDAIREQIGLEYPEFE